MEGTYIYGMSFSSQSTGRCVMTSMGEMSPAMTHILRLQREVKNAIKALSFTGLATPYSATGGVVMLTR